MSECWADDERMDVLFSPFRENRSVNPQSWDAKLKFWTHALLKEMAAKREVMFDSKTVRQKFWRNGKTPACINTVLQELLRQGKILHINQFQASAQGTSWLKWGVNNLMVKPLSWTWAAVMGQSNKQLEGDYVLVELVEAFAEELVTTVHGSVKHKATDYILDWVTLKELSKDIVGDEQTLNLVLLHLVKNKRVHITEDQGSKTKVVKFVKKEQRSASPVSEVEMGVLRLKETETHLLSEVEKLSGDIQRCLQDARFYIRKGLKTTAKNSLRRKKTLEKVMEKREAALHTVQSLIQRIQDAESERMIVEAYEAGLTALKQKSKSDDMNVERVDNIMDALEEIFESQADITSALSQGPPAMDGDISTAELESELDDLLAGESVEGLVSDLEGLTVTKQGHPNPADSLPNVPTFDPNLMELKPGDEIAQDKRDKTGVLVS